MPPDESLPEDDFSKLLSQFRTALASNNVGEADQAIQDILSFADDWRTDETPDSVLTDAARQCEETADWVGAERAYLEILSLDQRDALAQYHVHNNLAALYILLDRRKDAAVQCGLAVAAARRADTPVLLTIALANYASCLLKAEIIEDVAESLKEAIEIVSGDAASNQIHAKILTTRAQYAIRIGDLHSAVSDLESASALLQPWLAVTLAAGVHADMAKWWAVTGEFRLMQHRTSDAVEAWGCAVSIRRQVASLSHVDRVYGDFAVATSLAGLAEALAQAGRDVESTAAKAEQQALLQQIGAPLQ